jgi:hypothetical protein
MIVSQRGVNEVKVATHDFITWTVILGELVVNSLVANGIEAVVGGPRRARKAGRSSLEFIGKKAGLETTEGEFL